MSSDVHRWSIETGAGQHEVMLTEVGFQAFVAWTVDGIQVAEGETKDGKLVLSSAEHGSLHVRLTGLGRPRRVTWFDTVPAGREAPLGGLDLDPEPGSPAARHQAWAKEHPVRFAVRHALVKGAGALAAIAVPLLLLALVGRLLDAIPWPSIPWPGLPGLDLPDPPDIPLPHLPELSLPGWAKTVGWWLQYLWPFLLGLCLAVAELWRRRRQERLKASLQRRPACAGERT